MIFQHFNLLMQRTVLDNVCFSLEILGMKKKEAREKARDLLLSEADKDISQIADAVGYNNSTYFTTAFKKFYGVTPSRFRDYHAVSELEGGSASRE